MAVVRAVTLCTNHQLIVIKFMFNIIYQEPAIVFNKGTFDEIIYFSFFSFLSQLEANIMVAPM